MGIPPCKKLKDSPNPPRFGGAFFCSLRIGGIQVAPVDALNRGKPSFFT
jgi:hypothetical protein